ncbi:MAG: hypothetical protein QM777_26815 [Pseudorhodoferax sp.]
MEALTGCRGQWLRGLPRVPDGLRAPRPDVAPFTAEEASGFGLLRAVRPAMQLGRTPAVHARPSMPPGSDAAALVSRARASRAATRPQAIHGR